MKRYAIATVAFLFLVAPWRQTSTADQAAYTVETLGTSSNIDNLVPSETGINASGQVSGYVTDSLHRTRAVRYVDGVGWEYLPGLTWGSDAMGINVHGDVVGTQLVGSLKHAYRYNFATGVVDDILPLPNSSTNTGLAINDNGDVVGQSAVGGSQLGFIAHPGLPAVTLPTLGGNIGMPCGINNTGQIAETTTNHGGSQLAARIESDDATILDIGSFDGLNTGFSQACAIDELGHVAGFSLDSNLNVYRAFRYDDGNPGHMVPVDGTLPSLIANVESIASGMSAGWYISSVDFNQYAMLHTDANGAVDLNTQLPANSGWVLTEVKGINASGQMVGDGFLNGGTVATVFRLTPVKTKDTTAPVISGVTATPSTVSMVNGQLVNVAVDFMATDDSGQIPTCQLVASGPGVEGVDFAVTGPHSGNVKAVGGRTYTFTVTCSDAAGNSSSSPATVAVQTDTTAPVINSMTAAPSPIWPPKGQMVGVAVNVGATDDSGVVSCKLTGITVNGAATPDAQVTGDFTGNVKAVGGRTYTFAAQCADFSGNTSSKSVDVLVTPDTTAPVISGVSVSPDHIWPPNGKMVPVSMMVTATDNVDPSPSCALTSVSGGAPGSSAVTGQFSANVRSDNGAVYTLTVTCSDFSGNKSSASTKVVVAKTNGKTTTTTGGLDDDRDDHDRGAKRDRDDRDDRKGDRKDDRKDDRGGSAEAASSYLSRGSSR